MARRPSVTTRWTNCIVVPTHSPFYDLQVVRSRLQQRQGSRPVQYQGVAATFRLILQREGIVGLYKGIVPNVLRVMPQSAITFLVYEK